MITELENGIYDLFNPDALAHALYDKQGAAAIEMAFAMEKMAHVDGSQRVAILWAQVQQRLAPDGYGTSH